jgi:hypothetical protein
VTKCEHGKDVDPLHVSMTECQECDWCESCAKVRKWQGEFCTGCGAEWGVDRTMLSGVLCKAERLLNSKNGNPRYRVTLSTGITANTKTDASCGYEVTNWMNKWVVIEMEDGQIVRFR